MPGPTQSVARGDIVTDIVSMVLNSGVGTTEQSTNSEQGLATDSLSTILPGPTQSVAKGDIVTDIASMVLKSLCWLYLLTGALSS